MRCSDPEDSYSLSVSQGDGNIRCYTVSAVKPYAHFLSEYRSASPQRGLGTHSYSVMLA